MSRFWSAFVHNLVPYVPGEQPKITNLVKLNTNENPYPPSPKAVEAMRAVLGDELRLYPDPNADGLKDAIARFYGLARQQIFVGNGSDEVLAHVFYGLLKHDKPVLFPDITYSFYTVYCNLYGIRYEQLPLTPSYQIGLADYAKPNGGIIFPNPNAPTGIAVSSSAIRHLLQQNRDSVIVIDEAYVDFGAESVVPLIHEFPNLLVTQTVSKSRSLAGLRVGLAVGHPDLIEALERVKNSFNSYPLGRMAIVGAAAAFDDVEYFRTTTCKVVESRETLVRNLETLGFEVLPSSANFVFARHPGHDGEKLAKTLREKAVLVRHFRASRIEQFLRITVGSDEQNAALISALKEIL